MTLFFLTETVLFCFPEELGALGAFKCVVNPWPLWFASCCLLEPEGQQFVVSAAGVPSQRKVMQGPLGMQPPITEWG